MKTTTLALCLAAVCVGCGAKKPAQAADAEMTEGSTSSDDASSDKPRERKREKKAEGDAKEGDAKEGDETTGPKKDECVGFEIAKLEDMLNKGACEVDNPKPDDKFLDVKDKLDIKVSAVPLKVSPGHHVDVVVTFTNKTKQNLPLLFTVDPTPRFEIEAYDAKSRRVDRPLSEPPPLPKGVAPRQPGDPKTAKVILAANGSARVALGWDAVKMAWAPDKVRGTPPEKGYPRKPAGPLPRGKYTLRVVTPLTAVVEGIDKEISAPRVPIEIGK
jgi:hypothetical protein